VRVFERHEPCANEVFVIGPEQAFELRVFEHASFACHRSRDEAAELRESALLVIVYVAAGFANQLVAWLTVNTERNLVGHRARWHKDRRFLAKQSSRFLLE